jgi:electron-transferring-flavoprotein dehydrogenase
MKSGLLAAEALFEELNSDSPAKTLEKFDELFYRSNLRKELHEARNFSAGIHRFGFWLGAALAFIEQNILFGKSPFTIRDRSEDHAQLIPAGSAEQIKYPKPDGKISFDKASSVFLSNTNHAEDQPCHLKLKDPEIPINVNLPNFDEPAQRYCPAGVYEVLESANGVKHFQINAQNCVHCKTCDIKDPSQNIQWVVPEGGGGPVYPAM